MALSTNLTGARKLYYGVSVSCSGSGISLSLVCGDLEFMGREVLGCP